MDEASAEAAHDLTLDPIAPPPVSGAPRTASSGPPSLELMLRLDDLSQDGNDDEHKSGQDEDDSSPVQARRGQVDRDAKRMESRLQRNLKQQQAQYARQRKLFENMRAERACSASDSCDSPESVSSSDGQLLLVRQHLVCSSPKKRPNCAKFRSQKEQLVRIGALSRQRSRSSAPEDDANDDDSHAQAMLRHIKDKARAEFHRQRLESGDGLMADIGAKAPTKFLEEMQQQVE